MRSTPGVLPPPLLNAGIVLPGESSLREVTTAARTTRYSGAAHRPENPFGVPPYKRLPFHVVCVSSTYFGPVGVQKCSEARGLRGSR